MYKGKSPSAGGTTRLPLGQCGAHEGKPRAAPCRPVLGNNWPRVVLVVHTHEFLATAPHRRASPQSLMASAREHQRCGYATDFQEHNLSGRSCERCPSRRASRLSLRCTLAQVSVAPSARLSLSCFLDIRAHSCIPDSVRPCPKPFPRRGDRCPIGRVAQKAPRCAGSPRNVQ